MTTCLFYMAQKRPDKRKFNDKEKWCNAGLHWQPRSAFGPNTREISGLQCYCRPCQAKKKLDGRHKDVAAYNAAHRAYMRVYNHGISDAEVKILLEEQNYCCAICGVPVDLSSPLDHDHVTGKVRGVLCRGCNWGLGHFKDSTERLENAVIYLRKHELSVLKIGDSILS